MADDNQQFQAAAANAAPVAKPDTASVTEGTTTYTPVLTGSVFDNDTDDGGTAALRIVSFEYGGVTYPAGGLNTAYGQFGLSSSGRYTFIVNDSASAVNGLAPGETLTEQITYTVRDASGATSTATLTLTIHGANDAPTFTSSAWSTLEGIGTGSMPLFYNGADPEGEPLTVVTAGPLPAGFSIDYATNRLIFDSNNPAYDSLAQGQVRHVFVEFGLSDGDATKWGNVWVQINGRNDAPVAPAINVYVEEGGAPVTVDALQNASDPDAGAVLSVTSVIGPPPAVTYNAATHTFTIDPSHPSYDWVRAGQTIPLGVSYSVSDGLTETRTTVWVHVTGKNDLPTAKADTGSAREAGAFGGGAWAMGNVLSNDTDPDSGDSKTVGAVAFNGVQGAVGQAVNGAYGSLTLQANGQYTYRVNDGHAAVNQLKDGQTLTEVFTYTMKDGSGATATSTLTVTIDGVNDAPRVQFNLLLRGAEGDAAETFDARLFVSDPEDALTIVNMPANLFPGLTYNAATQEFTFDASHPAYDHLAAGVVQRATITYGVSDGAATATQRLSLELTGVNDAPVAAAIPTAQATEGGAAVTIDGLLGATDVDDGAVLQVVAPAALPAGVVYANGGFSLDPTHAAFDSLAAGEVRTVSVDFQVSDGTAAVTRTASWTVTGVNDAPTASAIPTASATEGGTAVAVNGLSGASDVDAGAVLAVVAPGELPAGVSYAGGVFTLDPTNSAFDSLAAGQTRTVSVEFQVSDGTAAVARTASWVVAGVNDAPVAQNDTGVADEKQTVQLDVLANDRDPDAGDTLTLVEVGVSAKGSGLQIVDGKIAFTAGPAYDRLGPGQTDQETFTYTVRDGAGVERTASVTVTVRGVADGATLNGTNKSDTLIGDGLDQQIVGGNGEDVLRGLGGADRLAGDNGKDELYGGDGWDALDGGTGADRLDGGAGADSLAGGNGPDLFVFDGVGFGRDVVLDFAEEDQVQFSRGAFADFAAVRASAAQVGGDVVITLDGANTVTLQGVSLASLDAGDFLFA